MQWFYNMPLALSIIIAKVSKFILSIFNKRGGSLPGRLGMLICNNPISKIKLPSTVIIITGTNGKTTTTNLMYQVLKRHYPKVVGNIGGDNLLNGITTTLLTNANIKGEIKADALVLEVDELSVPNIIKNLKVSHLLVNNLFRDQLDRAGEMETVIRKLSNAINDYQGILILNGDDPNVSRLGYHKNNAIYFKANKYHNSKTSIDEVLEGKFCFNCKKELKYDYYQYSHIGNFKCDNCDFGEFKATIYGELLKDDASLFSCDNYTFNNPYNTIYSLYNCLAIITIGNNLKIANDTINSAFKSFKMNDGRMEEFKLNRSIILNLIKNPTGANEVIKYVNTSTNKKDILIVLNDNDQDGIDVSWIYDVKFEMLIESNVENIICSGTRAYDIAICLKYNNYTNNLIVIEDLDDATLKMLDYDNEAYALVTYTALQKTRKSLKRLIK